MNAQSTSGYRAGSQYFPPSMLLRGQASQNGDIKTFDFLSYPYKRLIAIQSEMKKSWRHWSQHAGPNLFVRSKWHTAQRNVTVRDIVWLYSHNLLRGRFKLGRSLKAKTVQSQVKRENVQATILQGDVRLLVVLLPAEEQGQPS